MYIIRSSVSELHADPDPANNLNVDPDPARICLQFRIQAPQEQNYKISLALKQ